MFSSFIFIIIFQKLNIKKDDKRQLINGYDDLFFQEINAKINTICLS